MVRDGFQTISFSYIDSSFLQNLESAKKKKNHALRNCRSGLSGKKGAGKKETKARTIRGSKKNQSRGKGSEYVQINDLSSLVLHFGGFCV